VKRINLTAERPWTVWRNPHGDQQLIGYARVSTREQNLDAQLLRLREAKCGRIFAEKVSGAQSVRPGWSALVDELRAGDTVLVLRIDRMGRRLAELVRSVDKIRELGAHVRSIEESIDTSQRGGRFALNMVAAMAEKVRDDIAENTRAGLRAAKLRGKVLGRPRKVDAARDRASDGTRQDDGEPRAAARVITARRPAADGLTRHGEAMTKGCAECDAPLVEFVYSIGFRERLCLACADRIERCAHERGDQVQRYDTDGVGFRVWRCDLCNGEWIDGL
jgi:DNA invertase Pin-like site-specific DNA recombinase